MKDTSINAFIELLQEGKINKQEKKVLDSIYSTPMTSRQIAAQTEIERSSVCGRINSLMDKHLVCEFDIIKCPVTGKQVHRYALKSDEVAA